MSNSKFGFRTRTGTIPAIINGLGVYDADAQSFINTAGITDVTQKEAISQLVQDLKSYGIWTKMRALYPFVGGTATSHSYNLKNTAQYQITWFGGMTHDSNGITGNGSNAYGYTNFPNNNIPQLSNHISIYSRSNYDNRGAEIAANTNAGGFGSGTQILYNGLFRSINQGSTETQISYSDSLGLYISNRISVSQVIVQKNNIQNIVSSTANSHTGSIFHLLRQGDSSAYAFQFSPRNLAFASIGDGFTSTEAYNFYVAIQKFQITLGRSVGGVFVTDPDAQAFVFSAQISNQTQANAVDNLVISLKNAGLWTKFKAIYPFVGGTATTHSFNLKDVTKYKITWNGGITHDANGVTGNATTGYGNTNLQPSIDLLLDDNHISLYNRTNNQTSIPAMGIDDSLINAGLYIAMRNASDQSTYKNNDNTASTVSNFDARGLYVNSRIASNSKKLYKNGIAISTLTTASIALSAATIPILARSNYNGINGYVSNNLAFSTIGFGLNDSETSTLYNIIQTYQTTLGRQV